MRPTPITSGERAEATIGPYAFDVVEVENDGGWMSPTYTTDRGFEWSTHAGREPLEVTVEAWVPKARLSDVQALREETEPVSASVGHVYIDAARIESIETEDDGTAAGRVFVEFELAEVDRGRLEETPGTFETTGMEMHAAARRKFRSYAEPTSISDTGASSPLEEATGGSIQDEETAHAALSKIPR